MTNPTKVLLSLLAFASLSLATATVESIPPPTGSGGFKSDIVLRRDIEGRGIVPPSGHEGHHHKMIKRSATTTAATSKITGKVQIVDALTNHVYGYLSNSGRTALGDVYYWAAQSKALTVVLQTDTKADAKKHRFEIAEAKTGILVGGEEVHYESTFNYGGLIGATHSTSTTGKGTETKIYTLTSGNHLLLHWITGKTSKQATFFVANYQGNIEGLFVGYTTDYTTLAKEFGVGLQREAVLKFIES